MLSTTTPPAPPSTLRDQHTTPLGQYAPPVRNARTLGSDPEDRLGYRPSTSGASLHVALPGIAVVGPPEWMSVRSWCGVWVWANDRPPLNEWGRWPACRACLPAYCRHIVLAQLGRTPPGLAAATLQELLPDRSVPQTLNDLVRAGWIEPTATSTIVTFKIRPSSPAGTYLVRAR